MSLAPGPKEPKTPIEPLPEADSARASALDHLRNLPQYLLPQRGLTRLVHYLTRVSTPWFKDALIRVFIRLFRIDLSEAATPNPRAYSDFNQFFTRALRDGARPLAPEPDAICSPVDATVSQIGSISDDGILQAKGHRFSLTALLGGSADRARPFRNGDFVTLYLSPRDYHRIHMPVSGRLRETVHIPGRLFSVSPLTTRMVPALFARNERVAAIFDTELGPMAMVMVGAINVASIETVWAGPITPPLGKTIRVWRHAQSGTEAISLAKGVEMGRFNMGSTVILLFSKGAIRWDSRLKPETKVRMGLLLARGLR